MRLNELISATFQMVGPKLNKNYHKWVCSIIFDITGYFNKHYNKNCN